MNTEVAIPQTFEQKMKNRIRDSIGDLITDEELKKMIDRTMEESFFTKRPNPKYNHYGNRSTEPEYLPPFIHEIVNELVRPSVDKFISEYMKEHSEEMIAAIEKVCSNGIGNAVLGAMDAKLYSQLSSFQFNVIQQLSNSK